MKKFMIPTLIIGPSIVCVIALILTWYNMIRTSNIQDDNFLYIPHDPVEIESAGSDSTDITFNSDVVIGSACYLAIYIDMDWLTPDIEQYRKDVIPNAEKYADVCIHINGEDYTFTLDEFIKLIQRKE